MTGYSVSTHAAEQFQNRLWLGEGSFIPWRQIHEKITNLLKASDIFPTDEPSIVEYRTGSWVFIVGQGEKGRDGLPLVITVKLQLKKGRLWSCPRRKIAVPLYFKNGGNLISYLHWGALTSERIFEFDPPVSLKEILYALRSFGCSISKEDEWEEPQTLDWVSIPVFLPQQPVRLEEVRKIEKELSVVPTKRKHGKEPMVVSGMSDQYNKLQEFFTEQLSR